jgi:hypothetical protein
MHSYIIVANAGFYAEHNSNLGNCLKKLGVEIGSIAQVFEVFCSFLFSDS